jgi:hypothetical protein
MPAQPHVVSEDKIKRQFPWYRRMHTLMGTSPNLSQAATHGGSALDLSLLERNDGVCHTFVFNASY